MEKNVILNLKIKSYTFKVLEGVKEKHKLKSNGDAIDKFVWLSAKKLVKND